MNEDERTDLLGVPHNLPLWRRNLLAIVLVVGAIALFVRFGLFGF